MKKLFYSVCVILVGIVVVAMNNLDNSVRKNDIIYILCDALRSDRLGIYGYSKPTSPNIDAMGKNSLVFLDHSSNYTGTGGSLPKMFSGVFDSYTLTHWIPRWEEVAHVPPKGYSYFYEDLRAEGYHTVIVSAHRGLDGSMMAQKFDEVYMMDNPQRGYPTIYEMLPKIKEILKKPRKKPIFLYIHLMDTHFPHAKNKFFSLFFDDPEYVSVRLDTIGMEHIMTGSFPEKEMRYISAVYDADVKQTDDGIGQLLSYLKKKGQYDSSHIIITSDHGELLGEHSDSRIGHALLPWQKGISIPFIWKWPANKYAGLSITFPTSHLDVKPTILSSILGHEILDNYMYDGLPLINDGRIIEEPVRMIELPNGFRYGQIKFFAEEINENQYNNYIFDLESDPLEKNNLVKSIRLNWHPDEKISTGKYIFPKSSFFLSFTDDNFVPISDNIIKETSAVSLHYSSNLKQLKSSKDSYWSRSKNGLWITPFEKPKQFDGEFIFPVLMDGDYSLSAILYQAPKWQFSSIEIRINEDEGSWKLLTTKNFKKKGLPAFQENPIMPVGIATIKNGKLRISLRQVKDCVQGINRCGAMITYLRLTPQSDSATSDQGKILTDKEAAERLNTLKSLGYLQ